MKVIIDRFVFTDGFIDSFASVLTHKKVLRAFPDCWRKYSWLVRLFHDFLIGRKKGYLIWDPEKAAVMGCCFVDMATRDEVEIHGAMLPDYWGYRCWVDPLIEMVAEDTGAQKIYANIPRDNRSAKALFEQNGFSVKQMKLSESEYDGELVYIWEYEKEVA